MAHPQGLGSLLSDGDTGWHIRAGELILQTGRVPVADPFSFSRPQQPWFAWEWLADVVFAETWRWRGLAGVAALAGVVLALAATATAGTHSAPRQRIVGRAGRDHGGGERFEHSLPGAAARLFDPAFIRWRSGYWRRTGDRRGRLVWLLVPLTALWANLHAGFVAWLATLGLLVLFCAAQRDWSGRAPLRHAGGALLAWRVC